MPFLPNKTHTGLEPRDLVGAVPATFGHADARGNAEDLIDILMRMANAQKTHSAGVEQPLRDVVGEQ